MTGRIIVLDHCGDHCEDHCKTHFSEVTSRKESFAEKFSRKRTLLFKTLIARTIPGDFEQFLSC